MHIMIYNKIVIFKNYITTCLRGKKWRGTVITYCEASKKIPNATDNIILRIKKKRKDYKDDCAQFQWISYENPGFSLASISPGAMEGKRRGSGCRESVAPWRTRPSSWEYLMLSLSRQEGRRDKLGNSPDSPLTEVGKSWRLWEGEGWKAGFSTLWVRIQPRSPQGAGRERELQELAEVEVSTQAFIAPMGNAYE